MLCPSAGTRMWTKSVYHSQKNDAASRMHLRRLTLFVFPLPTRTSRYVVTGWEAGDRWHRGGSVVWSSTQPRKRRLSCPGGVCWWTKQRVGTERRWDKSYVLYLFFLFIRQPCGLVSVFRSRPRGVISTPVIRTFVRGGRCHARVFKSQGAYLVSQWGIILHIALTLLL